jgi:type IX secretion system PorP/SprF family membrane protein
MEMTIMKSISIKKMGGLKKSAFVFLFVCLFLGAKAQQDPMYSMYMFNPLAINPAYAGSLDQMSATGLFRRQWLNFPGAPQTATFTFHSPLKNENVGVGFSFINDRLGEMATNGFMGTYAYHLKFEKSRLSFGLQAGVRNFSIPLSEIKLSPNQTYDDAFAGNVSQWSMNFGTGAYWYSNKWYLGLGIPHLRNNILSSVQFNTLYVARLRTHMNLTGGYVFKLSPTLKLKPSFMVKYVGGAPVQADLNVNLYWLDLIGLGISYRTNDALVFMAEIQLNKNFRFGYAYDQTISTLSGYTGGSHELMLRCDFGFNKNKTVTPRYF